MPGGDGTGPAGMGSMTGRGAGYCAGYQAPGFMSPIPGRGFGRGWGRGMGRGRGMGWGRGRGWAGFGMGYPAGGGVSPYAGAYPYGGANPYGTNPYGANPYGQAMTPKDEINMLRTEAEAMDQQMEEIQNRIKTLEKTEAEVKKTK